MISSLPININDILVMKKKIPIFLFFFFLVNFGDSSRGRCEICCSCHHMNPLLFQGGATRSSRPRELVWVILPVFCYKRPLSRVGLPRPGTGSLWTGSLRVPFPGPQR